MFRYAIFIKVAAPPRFTVILFIYNSYSNRKLSVIGILRARRVGRKAMQAESRGATMPVPMIAGIFQAE
jgi:hypothetical protein